MPVDHRERAVEAAIEDCLLTRGGYAKADPENFDRERGSMIDALGEGQP